MYRVAAALLILTAVVSAAQAEDLNPAARYVIVQDVNTGAVLYERDADVAMPPASMSKLMTIAIVFERLAEGSLKLDDRLTVSEKAWRMQGSKMFVMLNDSVRVEDLIRGVIIDSGNDACVVLAEGLAGSEEAFAERMNQEAKKIGLTQSVFKNASGWPDPGHVMSARDLATLARYLIQKFPQYYHFFSEIDFTYGTDAKGRPIKQGNRNPLLYRPGGTDGLKTGHTDVSGYGLVGSALRQGRRVIVVFNGLHSMQQRADEASRLMDWAFREFEDYPLLKAGQPIEMADVWLGEQGQVPLVAGEDLTLTLRRTARPGMKVTAHYDQPIAAPVAKGQKVGTVTVEAPGLTQPVEVPLLVGAAVQRLGVGSRIGAAISYLIFGAKKSDAGPTTLLKALPQQQPMAPPPLPPALSNKPPADVE